MKKNICFLFLFITTNLFSQNLTLSEILKIKKMDLAKAEEYLTNKGWEFTDAEEEANGKMGSASFAYDKSEFSDKATSFITYYFSSYNLSKRINVQLHSKMKYNEYLSSIKSFGCKLLATKVIDGNIDKVYQGATTTFIISTSTSLNYNEVESSSWQFFLLDNNDFFRNFAKYYE
jgi:hypothetical protein